MGEDKLMTLYLGEAQISSNTPSVLRNIGEIVQSMVPLTDGALHLLDGSLINGSGVYSDLVNYIAELYNNTSTVTSNINKVGSLTDNNGILSGFSTSNYAKFPTNFQPSSNTWEMVWKITTGSNVSSTTAQQICVFSKGTTNDTRYASRILIQGGKFRFTITYNGTAWDIPSADGDPGVGTYSVQTNTTYWLKWEYTGSAYKLSYSLDGITYTQDINVASTTPVYNSPAFCAIGIWNNGSYLEPFLGSIDLNESYINIDGTRWWTGTTPTGFTDETTWQTSVSAYGVCGKFVYDSVNNTVRLPKTSSPLRYLIEKYKNGNNWYNVYSDGWCEQGGWVANNSTTTTITFLKEFVDTNYYIGGGLFNGTASATYEHFNFNTKAKGSIHFTTYDNYGLSWSAAGYIDVSNYIKTEIFEYIVLATSSKTEIQVDIDDIATDLNGKADVDFTNINNAGTSTGASWSMPSDTYEDLTLGSSGATYTSPANGWVVVSLAVNANGYVSLDSTWSQGNSANGAYVSVYKPFRKGKVFSVTYSGRTSTVQFRFYYAEGSKSEA